MDYGQERRESPTMNVIFLDIDGVLNNSERAHWLHENFKPGSGMGSLGELDAGNITIETVGWDPMCVAALWKIIEATDARIVISSTWRILHSLAEIRSYFKPFTPDGTIPMIVDKTDSLSGEVERPDGTVGRANRGDECHDWIVRAQERPRRSIGGAPTRWVCIDDDSDFHPWNNLVQTNFDTGLTFENADRAIEILTK